MMTDKKFIICFPFSLSLYLSTSYVSKKEEKKSAVEQKRQFAIRRRLQRTSSCGVILNIRFEIDFAFVDLSRFAYSHMSLPAELI